MKIKKMCYRTFIPIAIFILIISSIISVHKGLMKELLEREMCHIDHGPSQPVCKVRTNRVAFNFTVETNSQLRQLEGMLRLSSYIPAMFAFLAFTGVTDWLKVKEQIGLYVSTIIAVQSLVYMVFSLVRNWSVQYLLFGALMNVLYGDLQGAMLIGWVFAVSYTGQDTARTIFFIIVEGMSYAGIGLGYLAVEYVPKYAPLSYIYAASFSCSILCFFLALLSLPTTNSVNNRQVLKAENCKGITDNKLKDDGCNNPFNSLRSEYISGVVLAIVLTELGRCGYNALVYSSVTMAPVQLSHGSAIVFIFSTMTIQGFVSIAIAMILVKCFSASDGMLSMISLSSAAFWMALDGFAGSATMLYVLSCTLSVFSPFAIASLYSTGTKENDTVKGNNLMLFALFGFIRMFCEVLTTHKASILVKANRQIYKPFSYLIFAMLQLMAFIVIGSITLTFKKPIIDDIATSKHRVLTDEDESEEEIFSNQEHVPFLSGKEVH